MSNAAEDYLDHSFDDEFADLDLKWLPWVGSQYQASDYKTIVLGESIYLYGGEASRQRILDKHSLRHRHINHGILAKFKSRYLRNFERAVFKKARPNLTERTNLWTGVIYHNLVPRLLESLKERPTDNDYTQGWSDFLQITKIVKAERCIAYGLESRKIKALRDLLSDQHIESQLRRLTDVGSNRPLLLTFQLGASLMEVLFIRHPSAFFTWTKWALALREANMLPVAEMLSPTDSRSPT